MARNERKKDGLKERHKRSTDVYSPARKEQENQEFKATLSVLRARLNKWEGGREGSGGSRRLAEGRRKRKETEEWKTGKRKGRH